MTPSLTPVTTTRTTAAFTVQAVLSFAVSSVAVGIGVAALPVDGWVRAFLGLGLLYVVTSTFTLAKCVRDAQELATVRGRVDQARVDRLVAEHDPFAVPSL